MSLYEELLHLEDQGIDLVEVLGQDRLLQNPGELENILKRLGPSGDNLQVELLYFLTHRRFSAAQADSLWSAILKSKKEMEDRLGRSVCFRVAALDYLHTRVGLLRGVRLVGRTELDALLSYVNIDEVTSVYNRRFFNEHLNLEIQRARRYGSSLSLLVLDLDNFKLVNERFGHLEGDMTLRRTGRLLRESTRQNDMVCRYGGDEFAVLLPESSNSEAYTLAERIRKAIGRVVIRPPQERGEPGNGGSHSGEDLDLQLEDFVVLSASIGGATFPADCDEGEELVRVADRLCLEAKKLGKDRIRMSGELRTS